MAIVAARERCPKSAPSVGKGIDVVQQGREKPIHARTAHREAWRRIRLEGPALSLKKTAHISVGVNGVSTTTA